MKKGGKVGIRIEVGGRRRIGERTDDGSVGERIMGKKRRTGKRIDNVLSVRLLSTVLPTCGL